MVEEDPRGRDYDEEQIQHALEVRLALGDFLKRREKRSERKQIPFGISSLLVNADPLGPLRGVVEAGLIPATEPLQTTYQDFLSLAQPHGEIFILTNNLTPAEYASTDLLALFRDKLRYGTQLNIVFHQPDIR